MNFDPGRVRLSLQWQDDRVATVGLVCERPAVARVLRGQPAERAVALVPLVYSICGKAQGIAARAALAAARGQAVAAHVDGEAWAEAAREHAWKLCVDWPRQLGMAPDEAFFVRLVRSLPEQRPELATALAAHPLLESLRGAAGGGSAAQCLVRRLDERIGALADWLRARPGASGTVVATTPAPGVGESRVETARGVLEHRLVLDGERLADYAIVAPTDLLFAARGDAMRELEKLRGMTRSEAGRQVLLLMLAFDPCVPWEIE